MAQIKEKFKRFSLIFMAVADISYLCQMRIFFDLSNLPAFKNAVVTIGTFDGVHLGHRKIIAQLKEEAARINGETVIITFNPHPRKVVQSEPLALLNTLNEKLHLLKQNGIDNIIVVPFNESFAAQTAEAYVKDFLVGKVHPHTVIIGYDHHFGKNRTGDYYTLEKYGALLNFKVKEISQQVLHETVISSSQIRLALSEGNVAEANEWLGYTYFLEGKVVQGKQLGRTLGYPTANIAIDDKDKLIPAIGVYAVKVIIDGQSYNGMLGISLRPTIENSSNITVEVNIFDFNKDIYGKNIRVEMIAWLRPEQKFDSLDELQTALAADKKAAKKILAKI